MPLPENKDLRPGLRARLRDALIGPQLLAFMPALALGAFWLGGETALLVVAIVLPLTFATLGGLGSDTKDPVFQHDSVTGLGLRDTLETALERAMRRSIKSGRKCACILVEIDDLPDFIDRYGPVALDQMLNRIGDRLRGCLRDGDIVTRIGESRFGIATAPMLDLDLEAAIQMSARIQSAVEEPLSLDATTIYVSCSIGFCLSGRAAEKTGVAMLQAATTALSEATRNAPSAIRAYSDEMRLTQRARHVMAEEVFQALENGEIVPWFQPQVSTDTGKITGFEALARWCHPERGIVPPSEFLPALEQAGLLARLGEVILFQSLTAVQKWDKAGINVPNVAVNITSEELRNPKLIEKIRWELDRFDLAPKRLCIEVLETVVAASPDDVIARNINGLGELGCQIDLDDFGTGHASISSIRRFSVQRLKIDRSFVMKLDRDPEQQRMVTAILSMAERLGLETLAEGIESKGEHAMLAQLGCGYVQGFGIARPMPFDQTIDWVHSYSAKIKDAPAITRKTG